MFQKSWFSVDLSKQQSMSFRISCFNTELAHADFPNALWEIQFDGDDKWYYALDGSPIEGQVGVLIVSIHEVGQSIGLSHKSTKTIIMFPWY